MSVKGIEVRGTPTEVEMMVQAEINTLYKAGYAAAPIYGGSAPGVLVFALSPKAKGSSVQTFHLSDEVADFQRKVLFDNTGQHGMIVTETGKSWFFGTTTK